MTGVRACAKAIAYGESSTTRAEQRLRFLREIRVPFEIGHPSLVPIHDAYPSDSLSSFVIVMDFVERAMHLNDWCRGQLADVSLRAFPKLIAPLSLCHKKQLVHRDLKPSNILVQHNGTLRLLDFGLVAVLGAERATRDKQQLGTLEYISPEQLADSRSVDPRADVWSVGAMLLEALTGAPAFRRQTYPETLNAINNAEYVIPGGISEPIATVIRKCLSKSPSHRYPDATTLGAALDTALRTPAWKSDIKVTHLRPTTMQSFPSRDQAPYQPRINPQPTDSDYFMDVPLRHTIVPDFGAMDDQGRLIEPCDRCGETATTGSRCANCGHSITI